MDRKQFLRFISLIPILSSTSHFLASSRGATLTVKTLFPPGGSPEQFQRDQNLWYKDNFISNLIQDFKNQGFINKQFSESNPSYFITKIEFKDVNAINTFLNETLNSDKVDKNVRSKLGYELKISIS
jgi:hypothetical protein